MGKYCRRCGEDGDCVDCAKCGREMCSDCMTRAEAQTGHCHFCISGEPDSIETHRAAYRRGWRDALAASTSKAGSVTSKAKAKAARLNGAKGGRPRKSKD